jgi:hypothetical protein
MVAEPPESSELVSFSASCRGDAVTERQVSSAAIAVRFALGPMCPYRFAIRTAVEALTNGAWGQTSSVASARE